MFVETLETIFLASTAQHTYKLAYIQKAVIKFDLLKFFLRIAWETKALDTKKYSFLSESLAAIGKMLGGWHKNLQAQQIPSKKKGFER
ncbi:MAG: four helix bundle protein [Candidatus Kerfeldbacteria bacterium]|nr:four helix bundle protein [Candidatus Kerfeldbacteria bacterium]